MSPTCRLLPIADRSDEELEAEQLGRRTHDKNAWLDPLTSRACPKH